MYRRQSSTRLCDARALDIVSLENSITGIAFERLFQILASPKLNNNKAGANKVSRHDNALRSLEFSSNTSPSVLGRRVSHK